MLNLKGPIPRFLTAKDILSGKGSLAGLRSLPSVRCAVIGSKSVLGNHRNLIERQLKADHTLILEKPAGEPTLPMARSLGESLREFQPDWIVAVGGGSVLDLSKIAWLLYEHPDLDEVTLKRPFAVGDLRGRCRFAAIPTTAGTGSEVSSSAIYLDEESGSKHAVVTHEFIPDVVILDPRLYVGLHPNQIAATGLDALAHGIESYCSKFQNPLMDSMVKGLSLSILDALPKLYQEPDHQEYWMEMGFAALQAGWVQNFKVPGLGHALAHQLAHFGLSHGDAVAMCLPIAMEINCEDAQVLDKYNKLAQGMRFENAAALIEHLRDLVTSFGIYERCSHTFSKISQERDSVVEGALQDICARANPRDLDHSLVARALSTLIG